MLHHKLIAGETPGTYQVTDLVTDDDLLTIAQAVARQKLAKAQLSPINTWHSKRCKGCCKHETAKFLQHCSLITNTGS